MVSISKGRLFVFVNRFYIQNLAFGFEIVLCHIKIHKTRFISTEKVGLIVVSKINNTVDENYMKNELPFELIISWRLFFASLPKRFDQSLWKRI